MILVLKRILPEAENSDRGLTEEKGLLILDLKFIVLPLAMNTVVLKHVCLQAK